MVCDRGQNATTVVNPSLPVLLCGMDDLDTDTLTQFSGRLL